MAAPGKRDIQADSAVSPSSSSEAGCLVRLFWMIFGNLILAICAVKITHADGRSTPVADIVFWATVVALIGARRIDIYRFSGLTATGKPATPSDWKRYSIILVVVAAAAWGVSHLVGGGL